MNKIYDYTGQRFGNRIIIKNECDDEDWIKIEKPIPKEKGKYRLSKCTNCGAVLPIQIANIQKHPPKRCMFCSNIGNHYNIDTGLNSWVLKEDIALCNIIFQNEVITFVVDANKYDEVKQYKWRISKKKNKYYVVTGSGYKNNMQYLHQLIFGSVREGFEIDHIDGNSLNNRLSNLRMVTHLENIDNLRATRIDNTIGVRGISYDKRNGKFTVDFHYHGDRFYVKAWDTPEEAIYCRRCFEDYFGFELVKSNPQADLYQLRSKTKKKEIEKYVLEKISQKGRYESLHANKNMVKRTVK